MKSQDLKRPYCWEERTPILQDGVFHVPPQFSDFACYALPEWHDEQLFGNSNPIKIEYCSGNGGWIVDCSLKDPHSNWVAVEQKFDRVRKIWARKKRVNANNLIAVAGEGLTVTKHYFKEKSIQEIFINFPDPWPKKTPCKKSHYTTTLYPGNVAHFTRWRKSHNRYR